MRLSASQPTLLARQGCREDKIVHEGRMEKHMHQVPEFPDEHHHASEKCNADGCI